MISKVKQYELRSEVAATRLGILVVVVVLVIVAMIALPFIMKSNGRSARIGCTNNLKQIGLAFRTFALDNDGRFPMHVSLTNGGTMELAASGSVSFHFLVMSNELSTPKILACPNDANRNCVTTFANLSDTNISYFLNLDCVEMDPSSLLTGDGNLTNRRAAGSRFISVGKTTTLGWTKAMHREKGNLVLADGSVNLSAYRNGVVGGSFGITDGATNRLVIP